MSHARTHARTYFEQAAEAAARKAAAAAQAAAEEGAFKAKASTVEDLLSAHVIGIAREREGGGRRW